MDNAWRIADSVKRFDDEIIHGRMFETIITQETDEWMDEPTLWKS